MDNSVFLLLKELKSYIQEEAKILLKESKVKQYESPETKDLDESLAKAQGEYPKIHYNRVAPYFQKDYSDIDMILSVLRPILSKYGLNIRQTERLREDDSVIVITKLSHASGQWVSSECRLLPPNNDPLCRTSTKMQLLRSELLGILGASISDDPYDDNAEIQMADARQILAQGTQSPMLYNPRERSTECISRDQLEILEKEIETIPDYVNEIFKGADIQSLADLPKNKFLYTLNKVRDVREVRAGRLPKHK